MSRSGSDAPMMTAAREIAAADYRHLYGCCAIV